MKLYVVRHGRVPSNDKGIIVGRSPEELTEVGIKQALIVRDKLMGIDFDAIYCSPVVRTRQTADIINFKNQSIIYDERLAEREPGNLMGTKRKDVNKEYWNSLVLDKTPEGAETLKSGIERTKSFLNDITKKHKGQSVLVVTHSFNCKCFWVILNKITDSSKINQFTHDNDEIKIYDIDN